MGKAKRGKKSGANELIGEQKGAATVYHKHRGG